MKKHIRFCLILLLFSIFPQFSFSQDNVDDPCNWAYLFSIKKDFTIGKANTGSYFARNNDETPTYGIAAEKFLNNRWSLIGGLNVGIDRSTQEGNSGTDKFSQNELSFKLGTNYYYKGMKNIVNPYFGLWANYTSYSETQTSEPNNGNKNEQEYSSSTFGIGITGGAFVYPWKDVGVSIGAGYNFGYFISPESTFKNTVNGNSTETNGPSRSRLTDCGGELMLRYNF